MGLRQLFNRLAVNTKASAPGNDVLRLLSVLCVPSLLGLITTVRTYADVEAIIIWASEQGQVTSDNEERERDLKI
jgi:hypothetical protein